jgi:hypothetical protein
VISRCNTTGVFEMAAPAKGGVIIGSTEKKCNQGIFFGLNCVGCVTGRALQCAVVIKGKVLRYAYPVRRGYAHLMSGVIADLVTGIPHGPVMTGKTHCLRTNDRVFLEGSEGGFPVLPEESGKPPVVADRTFFGSVSTQGHFDLCRNKLGNDTEHDYV